MADPEAVSRLRTQLEQILSEWENLAVAWNDEDKQRLADDVRRPPGLVKSPAFDGVRVPFLSTTRVVVLVRCTEVLRHALEAFDG